MRVIVEVEVTPPPEIAEAVSIATDLMGPAGVSEENEEYLRGIVEFIANTYKWGVGSSWLSIDQKQEALYTLIKQETTRIRAYA